MPYLYGVADTKFVKGNNPRPRSRVWKTHFKRSHILRGKEYYNPNDVPLLFKTTPASLVELCTNVIDRFPIPSIYDWGELEVLKWLKDYGYPEYRNTFRVNLITGRKLLLVDATALSQMNIKNFDHIKHIAYGIRQLFYFEMISYFRSLTLADEYPYELFKLARTGITYVDIRRSDLWRRMQLIREKDPNLGHWELLDLWLRREPIRLFKEIIGFTPRYRLYRCDLEKGVDDESVSVEPTLCTCCIPPCDCFWTDRDLRMPWRLTCLPVSNQTLSRMRWHFDMHPCTECIPPCECRWPSRFYLTGTVMQCLQVKFPEKFCPIFDERIKADPRPSLIERWTRFSI